MLMGRWLDGKIEVVWGNLSSANVIVKADNDAYCLIFEDFGVKTIACKNKPEKLELFLLSKKELPQGEHKSPPKGYPRDKSQYADPEHYMFPIDSEKHVRAAIAYFNKHHWSAAEHKAKAAKRIVAAARRMGIHVDPKSGVGRAAGMKVKKDVGPGFTQDNPTTSF